MTAKVRTCLRTLIPQILFLFPYQPVSGGIFTVQTDNRSNVGFALGDIHINAHDPLAGPAGSVTHAEIGGTATWSGITASYSASATSALTPASEQIDFAPGGFLQASGQRPDAVDFVDLGYDGTVSGAYDYRDDLIHSVNNALKIVFHGHLDPGDSLHWSVSAQFSGSPIPELHSLSGDFTSGDFHEEVIVPRHSIDLGFNSLSFESLPTITSELSFELTKGGSGTSWVMLDDPTMSTEAITPADFAAPEPTSMFTWLAIGGLIAMLWQKRAKTQRRRNRGRTSASQTRPHFERLEDRSLMTAGLLDTSFSGDGFAQTAIGPGSDSARAIVVQPDGKAVVGGTTVQADGSAAIALTRFNTDGSLDATFGSGGNAVVAVCKSSVVNVVGMDAIALQPDGKIVAVSDQRCSGYATPFQIGVTRLNTNGTLDKTFGDKLKNAATGTALTPLSAAGGAGSIALQSDGKIVVAGSFDNKSLSPWRDNFAIWRYTAAGKLDTTFNTSGTVLTDFGSRADAFSVKIQPDGKIVAAGLVDAGNTFWNTALARYNTNGTLDSTFGTGGKTTVDLSGGGVHDYAQSIGIQPLAGGSYRLITTGYAEIVDPTNPNGRRPIMTVGAFTPSGGLDPTFGNDGIVEAEAPATPDSGIGQVKYWWGNSLAIQSDGKILVGAEGRTTNFSDLVGFGLARFTANGAVDTAFANAGTSFIDQLNGFAINSDSSNNVALDSSGHIYVAGQINTNPSSSSGLDFLVARYTSDSQTLSAATNDAALMLLLTSDTLTVRKKK